MVWPFQLQDTFSGGNMACIFAAATQAQWWHRPATALKSSILKMDAETPNRYLPAHPHPLDTLLLLVIPLSQTDLPTQLPPLCDPLLLHPPGNFDQLTEVSLTFPDQFPFPSQLLDQLVGSKVALCDKVAVNSNLRTGDRVHEGVDEFHQNRQPERSGVDETPAEAFWVVRLESVHGLERECMRYSDSFRSG